MAIIELKNVTKEYQLGTITGIKQNLANTARRLLGRQTYHREIFRALSDINLSIEEGEVVGILGTNGAGKSTLLKHLAGITTPTSGTVHVGGSVAPLIEVGAGLNPELSGRENIYLNSAILGLSRKVVHEKFDDIVSFAELEQFIDTPIKKYSSGMSVRLGFSIATTLNSEILIVDEVLAVGDLAFQRKCFERMEHMIKKQGKTVLMVSHNVRQIARMCSRAIILDKGEIIADGDAESVCNAYYKRSNQKITEYHKNSSLNSAHIQSSGEFQLLAIEIVNSIGDPIDEIDSGAPLTIEIKFKNSIKLTQPEFVIGTHTTDFVYLTANSSSIIDDRPDYECGTHSIIYQLEEFPLKSGTYAIRIAVFDKNRRSIFSGESLKTFSVTLSDLELREPGIRLLNNRAKWKFINS